MVSSRAQVWRASNEPAGRQRSRKTGQGHAREENVVHRGRSHVGPSEMGKWKGYGKVKERG